MDTQEYRVSLISVFSNYNLIRYICSETLSKSLTYNGYLFYDESWSFEDFKNNLNLFTATQKECPEIKIHSIKP